MLFRFSTKAAIFSTAVVAAQAAKEIETESNPTTERSNDDLTAAAARSQFVSSKMSASYDTDGKDEVMALPLRPSFFDDKGSKNLPVKTLRNVEDDQVDDPRPNTGRTATATTVFDPAEELGILHDARSPSDASTHRELDGLDCGGNHPVVGPNVSMYDLCFACYYEFGCPSAFRDVPFGCWDVSRVTSMKKAFLALISFNEDISSWDTSSVTDMTEMFNGAKFFNRPIGDWNTSKVENMKFMFDYAYTFNQPIENWDVSNVKTMQGTFTSARGFDQSLNKWNPVSVTTMRTMFRNAEYFNSDISDWNTPNVEDMTGMFYDAEEFNQDISSWNVSKVTGMDKMFFNAYRFNQPLDSWDVSSVKKMRVMFKRAKKFNQCLSTWADKTPNFVRTRKMFQGTQCPDRGVCYPYINSCFPNPNEGPWCQLEETCPIAL